MKQQINLFQLALRDPAPLFGARAMLRTLLAVLGGLGVVYVYASWQVGTLERQAQELSAARAGAEQRFTELQARLPKRGQDPALAARVTALQDELEQTRRLVSVLNEGAFGNTLGLSPYLAGLARQHVSGTWLTRIDIAAGGTQIGVEGRAQTPELVPMYLQRLSAEQVFDGKVFTHLQLVRDPTETAVTFALATSEMDAGIPVRGKTRER